MPTHRNAVELFAGEWASDLAEVLPDVAHVGTPMFYQDNRPRQAASVLGADERIDGMNVLELGPLEGAHSYQLEQLGAERILAIEANADAFQRCLVVKNILALDRTTFLLGDCATYLSTDETTFDLIFASGILYHMEDPVELIRLMAARSRKLFIWTQYYDPAFRYRNGKPLPHRPSRYAKDGLTLPVYEHVYAHRSRFRPDFFGGNRSRTCWLALEGIITALRHHGFDRIVEIEHERDGERGPAVTLAAERR